MKGLNCCLPSYSHDDWCQLDAKEQEAFEKAKVIDDALTKYRYAHIATFNREPKIWPVTRDEFATLKVAMRPWKMAPTEIDLYRDKQFEIVFERRIPGQ